MWLFLEGGRFLSIVADTGDSFLVQANLPGDIETNFPSVDIQEATGTEYRFSATVPRQTVMSVIQDELAGLNYSDLSKTVCNPNRVKAVNMVKEAMVDAQEVARRGGDVGSVCHATE
ncbi:MAG: hypothetical protein HQL69_22605 [Magnetococcales bacterium]|nr:hypothetical protein [Magnetococcales bacterium]